MRATSTRWAGVPDNWTFDEQGVSRAATAPLPDHVAARLAEFKAACPDSGALVLHDVPVGTLPATPDSPTAATTKDRQSEFSLLSVACALGEPVGYAPEHGGDLIQNIVPTQQASPRQVSTSSRVALMFHTEAAFHPHRPRYLLLLCLRGDPAAHTTLASIHQLLPHLPEGVADVLSQRRFRTAVDESYLHGRGNVLGEPMAVLTGDPRRPEMVFDADLMVGMDPEADDALLALSAAVDRHHTSVTLAAGDLLIVDNRASVHGRSPYQPRFDGTDRWLQRTFVVADLAASAGERHGRVIATQFGQT